MKTVSPDYRVGSKSNGPSGRGPIRRPHRNAHPRLRNWGTARAAEQRGGKRQTSTRRSLLGPEGASHGGRRRWRRLAGGEDWRAGVPPRGDQILRGTSSPGRVSSFFRLRFVRSVPPIPLSLGFDLVHGSIMC